VLKKATAELAELREAGEAGESKQLCRVFVKTKDKTVLQKDRER
jgi:hypothetical protein